MVRPENRKSAKSLIKLTQSVPIGFQQGWRLAGVPTAFEVQQRRFLDSKRFCCVAATLPVQQTVLLWSSTVNLSWPEPLQFVNGAWPWSSLGLCNRSPRHERSGSQEWVISRYQQCRPTRKRFWITPWTVKNRSACHLQRQVIRNTSVDFRHGLAKFWSCQITQDISDRLDTL